MMIADMAAGIVAIHVHAGGPNYAIVSACASGSHGIGEASEIIKRGDAVAMLAGGSEATITPLTMGAFSQIKAVSERNDEPERACRPFDLNRDGFVMSEGSVMMVLEDMDHAKKRGARIFAEIAGYGASADMYHFTAPQPEGKGAIRAMRSAIKKSGVEPDGDRLRQRPRHLDQARGRRGDEGDQRSVRRPRLQAGGQLDQVGARPPARARPGRSRPPPACSRSTAACMPPTINLDDPDPECDLDYVPNRARKADVKVAMSNSFGFGGHNATLVIKGPDGQLRRIAMANQLDFKELQELAAEILGIEPDQVQLDKSFAKDLAADSLDLVELIAAVEDKYDVELPEEELEKMKLIGDLWKFLEQKTAERLEA